MSTTDLIVDIQPGPCAIRGRLTSLDDKPSTVAVGKDGRVTPLFHFGLTDATGTIHGTAWDRNAEHRQLRVGQVVTVRNVVVKPCRPGFTDYHDFCFNFSKQSLIDVETSDDTSLPHRARPRVITLDVSHPSKRSRSPLTPHDSTAPCCMDMGEPFCSATGLPHPTSCDMCGATSAKKPFCPKTGLRHESH